MESYDLQAASTLKPWLILISPTPNTPSKMYSNGGGGVGGGGGSLYVHDPLQVQILQSRTSEELSQDVLSCSQPRFFNECNISTAINKFWKFRQDREREAKRRGMLFPYEHDALHRLFGAALQKDFQARQASTIVKAIGNGGFVLDDELGLEVVRHIVNRAHFQSYRPLEISHCIEAVTSLRLMNLGLFFRQVHQCLVKRSLRDFNPVDIAGVLLGFALCAPDCEANHLEVFELFATELETRDLSPNGDGELGKFEFTLSRVAAILTSFAMINFTKATDSLVTKLVDLVNRKMRDIKLLRCPEVTNLLWSCTVLGRSLVVGRELEYRTLKYFNTTQIASLAWSSVCNPSLGSERFYSNICVELKDRKFAELKTHDLVVLCWSLSSMNYMGSAVVLVQLANEVNQRRQNGGEFTKQQLVWLAWAFYKAGKLSPSSQSLLLLPSELRRLVLSANGKELSSKELAVLARVCSNDGEDEILFLPLLQQLEEGERGFPDVEWIDLAYFGIRPSSLAGEWLKPRILLVEIARLGMSSLARLCQVIARAGFNSLGLEMEQIALRVLELATKEEEGNGGFTGQNLQDLVCGFTELQFYHHNLFQFIAKRMMGVVNFPVLHVIWALLASGGFVSGEMLALMEVTTTTGNQQHLKWECAEAWRQRFPTTPIPALFTGISFEPHHGNEEDIINEMVQGLIALGYSGAKRQISVSEGMIRVSSNVMILVWNKGECELLEDLTTTRGGVDFTTRLWENQGYWIVVVPSLAWKNTPMGQRSMYLETKLAQLLA
ncbi:hypothetical protein BASA81_002724 [Batrachochytrium salamandrivorans]|nr:hypothetical protein BASA81_002724 [Batrachochytrium salamandrivorans]